MHIISDSQLYPNYIIRTSIIVINTPMMVMQLDYDVTGLEQRTWMTFVRSLHR